ncbi:MAG: hypothetical protein HKN82_09695 [Akkermansiaceae bacterium]|nr:hypothetical protein [Akkermansiaceae bacterium]NNM31163.1 hypothetical protein [Akkermansiaceae bacterium]
MKAKSFVPVLAAAALLAPGAFAEEFKREQDLSDKEGQAAPALNAGSWMNTPDGGALDLESLLGKVVVIDFWGTW